MLATTLVGPGSSLRTACGRQWIGRFRQAKFQERRFRGIRRQNNLIAVREPLPGDPLAIHGNSVVAPQVLDDPAVGLAKDFGMFAGDVRRVEDEVAHHAASHNDPGLVEVANNAIIADLKDELKSLTHVVLPASRM